jgi:Periplasmic protease
MSGRMATRMAVGIAMTIGIAVTAAAQAGCRGRKDPFGDLGIGLFQCVGADCLVAGRNTEAPAHSFLTEPRLWKLSPPAAGELRDGDVLVAVDGAPITTREAGKRLATLRPGEVATLRVRRADRSVDVRLQAIPSCVRPSIQLTSASGDPDVVSRLALERVLAAALSPGSTVDGRLGFILQTDRAASPALAPLVIDVRPRSPADVAGLKPGDAVIAIDGIPIASSQAREQLRAARRDSVRLTVRSGGQEHVVTIAVPLSP